MNHQHVFFSIAWRNGTKHVPTKMIVTALLGIAGLWPSLSSAQTAEDFLYSGKLAEGETALLASLEADPQNDNARFGLGVIQFGRGLENFLQGLNGHGFLTERTFGPIIPQELRDYFPDDPDPKTYSNAVFRRLVETWLADITKAEKTLAGINDPNVKLRLKPGLIKIDPSGRGEPVSAGTLLAMIYGVEDRERIAAFGLTLDRGDVHWLRGYLHLQAAIGETLLALDFSKMVEIGGHRLFEKVETPHDWLLLENRIIDANSTFLVGNTWLPSVDLMAMLLQYLNVPVIEPERFKSVHRHLQGTIDNGQKQWGFILAETDDDNEWIPNPRQTGSIGVAVTQEMIDTWLATLQEAELLLDGKKLVPFWRDYFGQGKMGDRGINLKSVFENPPKEISIALWLQGTAATPYLEKGAMTVFVDQQFLKRISEVFGSDFFGFAAWFN